MRNLRVWVGRAVSTLKGRKQGFRPVPQGLPNLRGTENCDPATFSFPKIRWDVNPQFELFNLEFAPGVLYYLLPLQLSI